MIILSAIHVVCNIVIMFIVDRFGRRPLLFFSLSVTSLSTFAMGFSFYLSNNGDDRFGWLPIVSLIIFSIGFGFGLGPVPFLIMGELFPIEQRSLLGSISGAANLFIMFVVVKLYHPLETVGFKF